MKERFKIIPEVFLLLMRDEKILLCKRQNTGWEDGKYGLPAGHGESGETMREGVCREALEEIGLPLTPDDLVFVHTQHRFCDDKENPHAHIGFYFTAPHFKGTPINNEPEKCSELSWFSLTSLPENIINHVRAVIEAYQRGEKYSEFNW
jgi:8-oxo-dGTP diphosphatase